MGKRNALGFCIIVLIISILACDVASPEQKEWVEGLQAESEAWQRGSSSPATSSGQSLMISTPDYSGYGVDVVSSVSSGTSVEEAQSPQLRFADGTNISFGYEISTGNVYYRIGRDREKHYVDTSGYNSGDDVYVVLRDPMGSIEVYHTTVP